MNTAINTLGIELPADGRCYEVAISIKQGNENGQVKELFESAVARFAAQRMGVSPPTPSNGSCSELYGEKIAYLGGGVHVVRVSDHLTEDMGYYRICAGPDEAAVGTVVELLDTLQKNSGFEMLEAKVHTSPGF